MHPPAPTLHELQRSLRDSLLHHAGDPACAHVIADGIDPAQRLGIYRHTIESTLARALRLSFPAVRHLVGPEFFDGAARLFAAESPPHHAGLDQFGAGFPQFLANLPQAAALPYLADLARLEWQVDLVLHAREAAPLAVERLARQDASALAAWRFEAHPAARLLWCEFPADAIWRALLERDDAALAAIDLADAPVGLLVHRSGGEIAACGVDIVRLDACAWRLTSALFSGLPLHAALEQAPCPDADAVLALHLAHGHFADTSGG